MSPWGEPGPPIVHLNWGTPGTPAGLNGSACNRVFYRGRDSVAGPNESHLITCTDCMAIYERVTNPPRMTFEDRVRMIAHTGEGSYGPLDWVAIGAMTLGIGIPIVFILKPFAKAYVKYKDRRLQRDSNPQPSR